jgi:hypothetical protein
MHLQELEYTISSECPVDAPDTLKTMQSHTLGWSIQNHCNGSNLNCGIGSTGWLLQSQSQPSASVSNSFSKSNNFIIKLTGCQCTCLWNKKCMQRQSSVAREKTTQRKLRRQNGRDDRRTVGLKNNQRLTLFGWCHMIWYGHMQDSPGHFTVESSSVLDSPLLHFNAE